MKKRNTYLLILSVALPVSLTGCDAINSIGTPKKTVEPVQETQPVNSLATIGGKSIRGEDFDAFLKLKRIPEGDTTRVNVARDQYLEREALASAIESTAFLDPAESAAEINEFRKEMLISRYFQKFLADKASDVEVRNFYESNATEYQQKRAKVAHILFRTTAQMDESERAEKLTRTREVISRLNAGEEFGLLAGEFSEDKISSGKDGNLGWIKEGSIDPRFSEAVFSMERDQVSEPVITTFGYHIVKLLDGPAVVTQAFETVKGDIRHQLRSQAKNAELDRLKALSEIVIIK